MKIGIFGRTYSQSKDVDSKAEEIGKLLASKNHTIFTGGTSGYPHTVAQSALNNNGKAVAYCVGLSQNDHNKFHHVDLSRYTDRIYQNTYLEDEISGADNYLRSLHLGLAIDCAVVIGGRVGTLYEITLLSGLGKDIFILENSGGITSNTMNEFIKEGHKNTSQILFFKNRVDLENLLEK